MSDHETAVALTRLEERLAMVQKEQAELRAQVDKITEQANKWKGGFIVLLGIGGFFGTLVTSIVGKWFN